MSKSRMTKVVRVKRLKTAKKKITKGVGRAKIGSTLKVK
jgi:hypothetical protein